MLFVVSRSEFVKRMDVVRDDRRRKRKAQVHPQTTPFLRLAATDDNRVCLSGLSAAVEFNATVHEPGVLFLRAGNFRTALRTLPDGPMIAIQADGKELVFGDVRFPMESNEMLLYPDPAKAPMIHPGDRLRARESIEEQISEARRRVEHAKERLVLAATGVVEEQAALERLLGQSLDTREVLLKIMEESMVKSAARMSKKSAKKTS